MKKDFGNERPTLGVLTGWQYYRTATNLSYLAPVFHGIIQAAQDMGCNVLIGCGLGPSASSTDPLRPAWPFVSPEHDFVPIGPENTDGLIVVSPLHSSARSKYIQGLIAAGHPVIFIGSGEIGPCILADNAGGVLNALRHLQGHGHHQIAFIAGTPDDMSGDSGDRLRAYRSGCEDFGFDRDPRLVAYGLHVYDSGYHAMRQIIDSGVKFTAVLASNDESALGAMKALEDAGRNIPQDVAIIGFDNRLEGAVNEPGLSSIHIPLSSMGYRAVELLLQNINGKVKLDGQVFVQTRLVVRESCGCNFQQDFTDEFAAVQDSRLFVGDNRDSSLVRAIATFVNNQTQNLTEEKCLDFSRHLVNAFVEGFQSGDSSKFYQNLDEILQDTATTNDDLHVWQAVLSLLEKEHADPYAANPAFTSAGKHMIRNGRLKISAQTQRQYRQYVSNERWNASRLSLLTSRLLIALDENQIYEILAKYLPAMNICTAMLVLFEAEGKDRVAWSMVRDVLAPDHQPFRFPSREFPPAGLFNPETPFHLVLIPVVDPSGQTGYMIFDTQQLDLYGAIVQQVGGALNTARLYRQAIEGRCLAEDANRMKSRFLSTISHELRTPLNLIVGLSGILIEESEEGKSSLSDPVHKDVERIHAYAQHLGGLIGDVLDLATNDAGQLHLNMELINLGETLHLVVESGAQLTADKGLLWKVSVPETGPWVWGDPTRLRQVVLNFVNNAVKFTTYGEISLSVEVSDGIVTVRVCDTGLGISPEEQPAIFGEFRRSERSIALGYPGLGLGLAICKMLIEMHNGKIGVESTGVEGEGACFYFMLPAVQPPPEQPAVSHEALTLKQTVLILVSHESYSERLRILLNQRGIKVYASLMNNISEWQSLLFKSPPDAIILDVSIQSDLGWSMLKAIKGSHLARGIPIMFYTSSEKGDALLNLDYLTKPIELSDLTEAFDHVRLMVDPDQPTCTFLVVDDEPNTLEMHARIVQSQSASYRVLQAQDGYQALEILGREKVDVVLLDLQMPGLDGFEVLEAMRTDERNRDTPVIVVTGKVLTEPDMARLNQGVATILSKGLFSIEETAIHIGNALERKRKLNQNAQHFVRQAMAFIHEHYAEQISRRDIAQRVSIAEDHLTFCFRQELGVTPMKYLQRFRVNQAKLLLRTSSKSITEIAFAVGFTDSGYFSRVFHRETGVSPEDFRLIR
jgi:signal transduction histidine kinase/DNA-binding response OmpR family regulator/ABC-type sugar transport system substrate-binding protein